jgi:hypothetical protein
MYMLLTIADTEFPIDMPSFHWKNLSTSFIDWYSYVSEETDNVKANANIWRLNINRLQLYEMARILNEGFWFSSKGT